MDQGMIISRQDGPDGSAALSSSASCPPAENDTGYSENRPQTRVSAISHQGPAHVDMSAQYDDEQQQSSDQQQDQQDQHGPPSSKRRRVRPPDNGGSTALSAAHHNAASAAAPLLPTTAATIPGQSAAINPLLDCIPGMVFTYQVNPDGTSSFAYVSSYSRIIFHRTPEQIMTNGPDEIFGLIMREDRVSFHGTLLASLREGTVWDWTGRVEVPPPPISEEAMAAGNGGGASAAGEVRTVRFTSASPPIRHRSSSDGDDDIPSSSSSDCYTAIFHGVVLDVTAQQQQQQQQQHIQAKQQHQQIVASTPPPPPTASAEMEAASSSESCSSSLRSVFDSAPHPIIALDASGIVTEWNRTAEILTGYAKHDAIGKNFVGEFVVGACRRDVLRMLDEVSHWEERSGSANRSSARGGKVGSGNGNTGGRGSASSATAASSFSSGGAGAEADPSCEATLQAMPGHPPVHLLLIASPKRESVDGSDATTTSAAGAAASCGGGVAGAVIIAQDMSKQHAALALHRSETEKGIMEWLSHEVRNPLSVAVEASRTLKEDPSDDPEENSNNLELICLSLGYIVELLTDMLDLNKCAEGKITMNPTVCRLREDIVLPTKRMLDQRRKSVDLIIDGGDEIWAYVDRLRLQQVLTNLIVNSMKYTSIGFIRVGIRRITREEIGGVHLECATGTRARYDLTQQQQPTMSSLFGEEEAASSSANDGLGEYGEGGGILMSVSDSGSGIDPSNYPNLFERWKRLGSKTNGTGIGLCLCRSLMEVMGGRIFLSKTYNSGIPGNPGCQFCIVLPPTALELSSGGSNGDNVLVPGANDGSSANEGPAICTAALSKRLSRDKNKPDGALRASPSPDDRLMPAPPPRLSPTPDVTSEWNGGANQHVDVARENGVSYRDGKKVSFAPQLDDSSYVPQQAPNPYKPNSGYIVTGNGTGAVSAIADGGASSSPVQKPSGGTLISTAPAASSSHHHQADDPFHNTCLTGKFRLLVVDDDETFRIMFVRRLKRMFPNGIVDESPSGEDSIEKAKANVYDLITMDHFMALDEMNGADTIRGLRANKCDACIVGISGNTKTVHHLEAGADDFVRKPVPVDRRFIRRLVTKMSPPAVWKVLIADDCKLNLKFMHRKLTKVSSPHYTTKKECEERWQFTLKTNGEDCVECLKDEWFDLCVLDQHMGPGLKGTDVASFIREGAVNKSAVVVINTGVEKNLQAQGNWDDSTVPFNFQWTKPAPSVEKIRQDLCLELVAEKTTSGANFGESLTKAALLKASVIDNEAGLEDSSQETQDDGASSVNSEGSSSEYDSSKLPEEEMKKLPEHRKVLQKLYDEIGDELAFCDMCNLFVSTVPSQLDDIDRTLKGHDWNNLSLILHKLKGTLQVFHIVDCVALIKPLYERSLVLKARGQKRKLRQDEPSSDDVADSELDQMRQSVEKLRIDVVAVIGVCKGVVDNGKQGETI